MALILGENIQILRYEKNSNMFKILGTRYKLSQCRFYHKRARGCPDDAKCTYIHGMEEKRFRHDLDLNSYNHGQSANQDFDQNLMNPEFTAENQNTVSMSDVYADLQTKEKELELKDKELSLRDKELKMKNKEIKMKDKEIKMKDKEIKMKDKEFDELEEANEHLEEKIKRRDGRLKRNREKYEELQEDYEDLQEKHKRTRSELTNMSNYL